MHSKDGAEFHHRDHGANEDVSLASIVSPIIGERRVKRVNLRRFDYGSSSGFASPFAKGED
jgi:hypothetical protein